MQAVAEVKQECQSKAVNTQRRIIATKEAQDADPGIKVRPQPVPLTAYHCGVYGL